MIKKIKNELKYLKTHRTLCCFAIIVVFLYLAVFRQSSNETIAPNISAVSSFVISALLFAYTLIWQPKILVKQSLFDRHYHMYKQLTEYINLIDENQKDINAVMQTCVKSPSDGMTLITPVAERDADILQKLKSVIFDWEFLFDVEEPVAFYQSYYEFAKTIKCLNAKMDDTQKTILLYENWNKVIEARKKISDEYLYKFRKQYITYFPNLKNIQDSLKYPNKDEE